MPWLASSAASNVPVRYARMSSYEQVISEVEIDGVWPWRRWELARTPNAKSPPDSP